MLVSELVTHAIQAAAGHQTHVPVRLRLSGDGARVLIEVWDADPRPPAPRDLGEDGLPDLEEEGGRGLFLVATLSTRWGWCPAQEPAGKVVWCELAGPPDPAEGHTPALLPPRCEFRPAVTLREARTGPVRASVSGDQAGSPG